MKTITCTKCGKQIEITNEDTTFTNPQEIEYFKQLLRLNFICQECKPITGKTNTSHKNTYKSKPYKNQHAQKI